MKKRNNLIDTNPEFLLQRWGNGIKLIRPDQDKKNKFLPPNANHTVASILQLPFCVYFLNTASEVQNINEQGLITSGFDSLQDSINKSMFDVATLETAQKTVNSHLATMKTNRIQIIEEDVIHKIALDFQCITTLLPWYSIENKIIGVFGCSIVFGKHLFAESLSHLVELNLMTSTQNAADQPSLGTEINLTYLSKREKDCIYYFVQGKTAKEIAAILRLSPRTVEHYIDNAKNKLGVFSKSELIIKIRPYYKNSIL